MNLFQEMEVNYKDFIESANDFMDSCRKNINEDEKISYQLGELIEKKRWKDKIKAKIEELEKEKNIPQEMDFKAFYRIKDLKNVEIAVLQSLLEKE